MTINARANKTWLAVWGKSANSHPVRVDLHNMWVLDSNGATVEITGNYGSPRTFYGKSVTGAGLVVDGGPAAEIFHLSYQDDVLNLGLGDDWAAGYYGDDLLFDQGGNDTLYGMQGDDQIFGEEGDDLIGGGQGNDTIDGGEGDDIAVYSGNFADYGIAVENGAFVITDLRAGSPDGTDTIANVETLRFADRDHAMPAAPTLLEAVSEGGLLILRGIAADEAPHNLIDVLSSQSLITDNGEVAVIVPISGETGPAFRFNARGVTGAGIRYSGSSTSHGDDVAIAHLSDQDDDAIGGSGDDWLAGYRGDDDLVGWLGEDTLIGMQGEDTLLGHNDDDILIGGTDDDVIDGGEGAGDIAIYSGNRADYELRIEQGNYVIEDLRAGSPDGTDFVGNVEILRFADQDQALTESPSALNAYANKTKLTIWGDVARDDWGGGVKIDLEEPSVLDNGAVAVSVPIAGQPTQITTLNARGVRGNSLFGRGSAGDDVMWLTDEDDMIFAGGGNDLLEGYGGFDRLYGDAGNDTLRGMEGTDGLFGGAGDDILDGGVDSDLIDGGGGNDIAIFTGDRADYEISFDGSSVFVMDLRAGAPDGRDVLVNVETLRFADQDYALAAASTSRMIDLVDIGYSDLFITG